MRKIYIVSPDTAIDASVAAAAQAENCTEIVSGIPPRLQREGVTGTFPFVYTEPDLPDKTAHAAAITVLRNTFQTTRTAAQMNNCIDAITVILRRIVGELNN